MYIRTKDGIYETSQTISVDFKECYIEAYDTQLERWVKKNIIKQSENLEELCDEFVDEDQHYILKNKNLLTDIPNKSALKNHRIYGAIWTSKGLIYVAKMNKKGELVLI